MRNLILLALLSSMLTACGFEVVDTGRRGIRVDLGKVEGEPLVEGLYFYNPFTSSIVEYSVQQETWKDKTSVFTKDTQRVEIEFAATYSADPVYVGELYKVFGRENQLEDKVIKPVITASIKDSIGGVIADELVGKREAITLAAKKAVQETLKERHVLLSDLQFTNLDFDDAYEKAVEQKVVATQEAQKAVNETVKIKEQAKQTVATAEAEATAMKIKTAALAQSHSLVELEAVKKWDGVLPQYILGGGATPFIDMAKLSNKKSKSE
jgi:prohibitin 2